MEETMTKFAPRDPENMNPYGSQNHPLPDCEALVNKEDIKAAFDRSIEEVIEAGKKRNLAVLNKYSLKHYFERKKMQEEDQKRLRAARLSRKPGRPKKTE